MENRSHALIAGIFTLLLGLAAVMSVWWFGGKREATRDYIVVTRQNVTGLSSQAPVRYRGIGVGKVQAIDLDPADVRNIRIRIRIDEAVPVTRGTTAKLGFQGVTGIAHILLEETGRDTTPLESDEDNPAQIAMQASLIEELSDVGGATLRQARDFLSNANQVLNAENRQQIGKTLANLEASTASLNETLLQVRQLLGPENQRRIQQLLAESSAAASEAGPLFAEARGVVASLQATSEKFDHVLGDPASGGAGALVPRLNELATEISATSRQLNRVLNMLEESPQRLIFGTRKNPPGPGESGFAVPAPVKVQP